MTRNTTITLGKDATAIIERQIGKGRFQSASDVVRAGLRLLEEYDARADELREALAEGEESGPGEPFEVEAFIASKRGGRP